MTSSKAKPVGRAVRKEPKVRVRKMHVSPQSMVRASWYTVYKKPPTLACTPCFVITNPPPGLSCAKLKRLVEIAASREEFNRHWDYACLAGELADNELAIRDTLAACLGLSGARGRKGKAKS